VKTHRIKPREVRLGDRILCSDHVARDVEIIDHLGEGRFRFHFTDEKWLEGEPGKRVTVVEPRPW
jgi:hypothetical protein